MPYAPGARWHAYTLREPVGVVGHIIPSGSAAACMPPSVASVSATALLRQPAVLVDTNLNMKVVREVFGSVVTAMPFDHPREIGVVATDTNYGLPAGVWTSDVSKAHRMAAQLRAGTVRVNCYNISDASLPFGGHKESGWGREMGHDALNKYLETKAVCIQI